MKIPVHIQVTQIAALPMMEAQRDLSAWLCEAEVAEYQALIIPKRRDEWLAGRILVKKTYSEQIAPAIHPRQLQILREPSQKPELLLNEQSTGMSISISHSHGWVAAALDPSGHPMGIDLERVEARDPAFLADYFTATEKNWIAQDGNLTPDQKITLIWSSKESVLKSLGLGLHLDPLRVEVSGIMVPTVVSEWGSGRAMVKTDEREVECFLRWQMMGEMVITFASGGERALQLTPFRHCEPEHYPGEAI